MAGLKGEAAATTFFAFSHEFKWFCSFAEWKAGSCDTKKIGGKKGANFKCNLNNLPQFDLVEHFNSKVKTGPADPERIRFWRPFKAFMSACIRGRFFLNLASFSLETTISILSQK
jgi:hypothetical protein